MFRLPKDLLFSVKGKVFMNRLFGSCLMQQWQTRPLGSCLLRFENFMSSGRSFNAMMYLCTMGHFESKNSLGTLMEHFFEESPPRLWYTNSGEKKLYLLLFLIWLFLPKSKFSHSIMVLAEWKNLLLSWRRFAINEVNDWDHSDLQNKKLVEKCFESQFDWY